MIDWAKHAGGSLAVTGRISQMPWQHLVDPIPGKQILYLDLEGGHQIVVYSATKPVCPGRVWLTGRVVEVAGAGKRPGSTERFVEYQLDVSRWECLAPGETDRQLRRLLDPGLSMEQKREAEEAIVRQGQAAFPELLAHLADLRVVWAEKTLLNEGQLMNAPVTAIPVEPEYREIPVTLGERCGQLLLRLITPPDYGSPFSGNFKPFQGGRGSSMFRVTDWPAWWERNRGESLDRIREELKPVIDRYWQAHGVEQVIP